MCVINKTCHSPYQKRYVTLKRMHEFTHSFTAWANYICLSSRADVECFSPPNPINAFGATGLWPINAIEPLMPMVQPDVLKKKSTSNSGRTLAPCVLLIRCLKTLLLEVRVVRRLLEGWVSLPLEFDTYPFSFVTCQDWTSLLLFHMDLYTRFLFL